MYHRDFPRLPMAGSTLLLFILITLSCKRTPHPEFSYTPAEDLEAGDSIVFINSSTNADSYEWEFGDGGNSSQKSPVYIYENSGIYDVRLTAFNKAGEESTSRSLTILEPTVLGFFVYDSTEDRALPDAEIWVYDNESDWDNLDDPLLTGTTDNEGFVVFNNVEPLVYYIWVIKEESGGFWGAGGHTTILNQNEINLYNVACTWVEEEVKASRNTRKQLEKISPADADL